MAVAAMIGGGGIGRARLPAFHRDGRFAFDPSSPQFARGRLTIRNARVANVEIPNNKRIETSLQYIHGIGQTTARQVLLDAGILNKKTQELSEEELSKIRDEVGKYMIEGDLVSFLSFFLPSLEVDRSKLLQRRFNQLNIQRLIDIKCYRGLRHLAGLPVRGQRTRNNCRTRKGKRRTIAGKKKPTR
ncbi:uncharacterized protein LOC112344143 isoform X1 [Selaginella moellendorffii]|uniref:uncharacterized protein LOC112344143 isoform X1 n=1 Tax=Selaginella moellendorffii TaxID=88036 RepID=UPI000D1CDD56|nr:uncharacterized protein LOC112344143 isoform X1 [Selaginella moellendorffii]|eukprot:XP_024524091.1 uncharacterized protein LOC112344143 isoform X1 [Selaginella moellendorffii]